MTSFRTYVYALVIVSSVFATPTFAQNKKIIVDQDARGPASTDMRSILMFAQSPDIDVLGITLVSGGVWVKEGTLHTLRALELAGRTDIPVLMGAEFPLLNSRQEAEHWEAMYGSISYKGAWDKRNYHEPDIIPPLKEGYPSTAPLDEHAANFIIRQVRENPGEVTLWAGGPLTNIALAMRLDPELPKLVKELVVMGAGFNVSQGGIQAANGRREFNWWFDPEAARMVMSAPWKKVTITPVDISVKTNLSDDLIDKIAKSDTPLADYHTKFARAGSYMWDELSAAAFIDPSIITKIDERLVNVDVDHGEGYGQTIFMQKHVTAPNWLWKAVEVQVDLDLVRFYRLYTDLMMRAPLRGESSVMLQSATGPPSLDGRNVRPSATANADERIKGFVDMDAYSSRATGTDMHSLLVLLQSPKVDVVGISVTSGDGWTKAATQSVLRLVEITGHSNVAVAQGAEYPLINSCKEAEHWEAAFGVMAYKGMCMDRFTHDPDDFPEQEHGLPSIQAIEQHGANFLIETLRQYPGEVVVWSGGPLTTIALALSMDPEIATLAKEFVHMGAGFNVDQGGNFRINGRLEFNWWWDPEAARIVLRAPWKKMTITPVDISVKTALTDDIKNQVKSGDSLTAKYLAQYWRPTGATVGPMNFMWDEVSAIALIHPEIITRQQELKVNVAIGHGPLYGQTIFVGKDVEAPDWLWRTAMVQEDLDLELFYKLFIDLMKQSPGDGIRSE